MPRKPKPDDLGATILASVILIGFVAICIAICANFNAYRNSPEAKRKRDASDIEGEVVAFAQDACRAKLTFPNNADFHWDYEIKEGVAGSRTWHVKGKVDTINALGAKPTLNWSAIVEMTKENPRRYKVVAADMSP